MICWKWNGFRRRYIMDRVYVEEVALLIWGVEREKEWGRRDKYRRGD